MALRELVTIAVRPRLRMAVCGVAERGRALTVGCSHNRQSYRPIYTTRSAVTAPCTSCGSASTITTPAIDIAAVTSGAPLSDSSTTRFDRPGAASIGLVRRTDRVASSAVESTPKASIGGQPDDFNDLSPTTGPARPPPTPTRPTNPTSPNARHPSPSAHSTSAGIPSGLEHGCHTERQVAATTSKLVRRTSVIEQLRPFVDEASANELVYPNKADRPWRYIVLHHSAAPEGSYDQIDREHRKILGFDGCGYHFVIGNGTGSDDGQIEIAQRWTNQKQGIHCRNARARTTSMSTASASAWWAISTSSRQRRVRSPPPKPWSLI